MAARAADGFSTPPAQLPPVALENSPQVRQLAGPLGPGGLNSGLGRQPPARRRQGAEAGPVESGESQLPFTYASAALPPLLQTAPGVTDCTAHIRNLAKWQPLCVPPTDWVPTTLTSPFPPPGACMPQAFGTRGAATATPLALSGAAMGAITAQLVGPDAAADPGFAAEMQQVGAWAAAGQLPRPHAAGGRLTIYVSADGWAAAR
jgi:hypothetical protein